MTFNYQGVYGPDVSFYQDDNLTPQKINFKTMKSAGATFVIIRVGQNTWVDSDFQDNYLFAEQAGLPRGAYWFYDSRSDPVKQADLCLSQLSESPELGIWLDLEENYNGPFKGWQNWKKCLDALRAELPPVGVYTSPGYWGQNRPLNAADLTYFGRYPLWIAHYGATTPQVPFPWMAPILWQYTKAEDGIEYGAESLNIDMNKFNGDMSAFCEYFDLTNISQPPSNGGTMALYEGTGKLSSTPYTRIRKPNPDGSLNPDGMTIGQINPGQAFKADAKALDNMSREWLHVYEVGGKPIDGWSAAWLLDYTETTPPPPPPAFKVPFTLSVEGFKPYTGELEKA